MISSDYISTGEFKFLHHSLCFSIEKMVHFYMIKWRKIHLRIQGTEKENDLADSCFLFTDERE